MLIVLSHSAELVRASKTVLKERKGILALFLIENYDFIISSLCIFMVDKDQIY